MYGIFHPFNNGFSALTFRPQLWIKGVPNFERNPELGAAAYIEEEKVRPSALTVRAWGAQNNSGGWDYLESPADSRARGGIVNGGILISPAEFEMEDYLGINSQEDTDSPTATTYVTFAPKVAAAFGKPTTVGVLSIGAKTIHQDTATGKLVVSEATDSLGATTDIIKLSLDADGFGYAEMQGTGAIKIPSGTTAERPSVAAAGMFRLNSSSGLLEYYDSSWLPAGTGYIPIDAVPTIGEMQTGTGTTVGGMTPALSRAGWLIKEAAAPSVAPPSSGMIHYDSTTGDIHFADGTATVNDWRLAFTADKGSRDFRLDDNEKLLLGDTDQLQIYSDGTHSWFQSVAGSTIKVSTASFSVLNTAQTEQMMYALAGGAVNLYYAGLSKLQTVTGGVSITGDLTLTGTVDGRDVATDGTKLDGIAAGADVSPVASVNAQTGVVVLDMDDVLDGTNRFGMNLAHKTMADNIDSISDQRMVGNISGLGGAPSAMTAAQVQTMNGFPVVSSGAGTPSSTPATIGDEYWDSTNNLWYKAKGTASAADWKLVDSCMASGFFTFNGTSNPTLENAKNLTLIRNGATGTYQAAIPAGLPNTDAAGKDYAVSITYYDATGSGAGLRFIHPTTKTPTVFNFLIRDNLGALTDAADTVEIHVHAIDL